MERDLNHDEHQFLAPGALMAREGDQPYKDYPLFHVPNLVFVYAAVAQATPYYILGAKCISVLATVVLIAALVIRGLRNDARAPLSWTFGITSCAVILLL